MEEDAHGILTQALAEENKGHAQRLRWTQRNSESNAKTIGSRTASDGEFVFSTTGKENEGHAQF